MAAGFEIWGNDGWQWLITFVAGGNQTGIGTGQYGVNLAAIRALNAAIRAENRADRQQCWASGHFVSRTGKCVDDPEIGVQKALDQLNGAGEDVFGPMSDLRRTRLEGYVANQFYREWENAVESGEGSNIQGVIDKYGQYSDLMSTNPFIGGMSFSLMNPQNVLDRVLIGDNDWGVTVQMCTTTVTTNCVDPRAIKDIWEDFGRHVQVIFKGLEIPGLPDWLPLPGIMRLPTIGEIWDKISGPFNDAAREQMRDCMSKDDDGDGVANTASYCIENRDIAGIITQGILDGAGEIVDATTEAIGGIVDKALEPLDCVTDPASCAAKVKDTIEGIFGSADPTQPGLPDWMRVIIIGSQYGDEVLKELEKIFNEDIDGDGTIGISPTQEYCADGVTIKKDAEGTNCPEYAPFGYCADGTTKKTDEVGTNCAEYAPNGYCQDGTTVKSDAAGTNCPEYSEFGYCQDGTTKKQDAAGTNCSEYAEFGYCEDGTTKKEDSAGTNCKEYTPDYGMCDDGLTKKTDAEGTNCPGPEPEVNPGDPCDLEDGKTGSYQYVGDELQCLPDAPEFGFCQDGVTEKADADGTNCSEYAPNGYCQDGTTKKDNAEGTNCTEYSEFGYCQDGTTKKTDAQGSNCSENIWDGNCTSPQPDAAQSFAHQAAHRAWAEQCGQTHCTDGSTIDSHVNGDCQLGLTSDCQDPQTDEQKRNCGWTECGTNTANPGVLVQSIDQCGSPACANGAVDYPTCTQCENGEHPDAHVDSDCSKPLKAQDGNPGDACTLYDNTVGVVDKNGDCKRVGQNCNRSKYGYTSSDNCDTGLGFNTSSGIIDSSGDCVCNTACADPNREVYPTTGACKDTCKKGWKKDAEGNCTVEDTVAEPCSDENRQKNNDGSCGENCNSGFDQPAGYEVCTSIQQLCADGAEGYGPDNELCGTTNGCPEGQKKFDGTNCDDPCPDNTDIGASDPLCGATPPETCDNDAVNYPDCNQCPKGKILYNGKCVVPTDAPCDEQNRVTNGDGTCGECKEGYTFDTNQDLCVRDIEECTNGATDYPTCTTCPEGQSMDTEGNCVTTTETCANGATDYPACTTCPEGQSMDENGACVGDGDGGGTTGGGGFGGGGGGMFDIKPITISGDPQLLSRTEFPITDFLAGLFTGSGGGRA